MTHGGKRPHSGRELKYGEETKPVRIPATLVATVQKFIINNCYKVPMYASKVPAGFPSPADDYLDASIDLNDYLIKHPAATFLVRAQGNSMINAGINEDDILIVDKSINPTPGKIVIASIDGQLTVKRYTKSNMGKAMLEADCPNGKNIQLNDESAVTIWGVVTNIIHEV